jgi:hypothetical protein
VYSLLRGRMNRAKGSLTDGSQGLEGFLYVGNEPKLGGEDVPHNALPIYYVGHSSGEETQGIGYPVEPSDDPIVRSELSIIAISLDHDRARH